MRGAHHAPLEHTYKEMRISNVYQRLDPGLRREIVEFWLGCRVLARNGWNYFATTPQGSEIWYVNFDGSLLAQQECPAVE